MEGPLHYICRVRLHGEHTLVAWYSDEPDGFFREAGGRLLAFPTLESLRSAAHSRGVALADVELTDYDFDRIRLWCVKLDAAGVDCPAFLNAWNFFDDLAGLHGGIESPDVPYVEMSRGAADCYEKLFWGNNMPSVTPPGERFEPVLSAEELAEICHVMQVGLRLLNGGLRAATAT